MLITRDLPRAGYFIVFEGIDGSGTSTQARLLHQHLVKNEIRAHLTAEPSESPIGHLIRDINLGRILIADESVLLDRIRLLLHAADRYDHLYNWKNATIGFLNTNFVVICTRYILSSFAYNAKEENEIALCNAINADLPDPDLTIYLDCRPEYAHARITGDHRLPDKHEFFDNLNATYQRYESCLAAYKAPVIKIDAMRKESDIHEDIISEVKKLIPTHVCDTSRHTSMQLWQTPL